VNQSEDLSDQIDRVARESALLLEEMERSNSSLMHAMEEKYELQSTISELQAKWSLSCNTSRQHLIVSGRLRSSSLRRLLTRSSLPLRLAFLKWRVYSCSSHISVLYEEVSVLRTIIQENSTNEENLQSQIRVVEEEANRLLVEVTNSASGLNMKNVENANLLSELRHVYITLRSKCLSSVLNRKFKYSLSFGFMKWYNSTLLFSNSKLLDSLDGVRHETQILYETAAALASEGELARVTDMYEAEVRSKAQLMRAYRENVLRRISSSRRISLAWSFNNWKERIVK
jgi:hypothetical protein